MSFTLSHDAELHLKATVDSYLSGRMHLDDLITKTKYGVRQLEYLLHTSNGFAQTLNLAKNYIPSEGRPIHASTLARTDSYRITLLGIPINAGIPLHDHPNIISIVAFLSGRIHSPIYRVTSLVHGYNLTELMNCSAQTYSQGDIALLTHETGNLHSLEGLTSKAACLSIQLSFSSNLKTQSYYFPAIPKVAASDRSLWYRIPLRSHQDGY